MSKGGAIKKLFEDKGFGFVRPDDGGDDVFVRCKENPCLLNCRRGDAVTFDTKWDDRKNKCYGTHLTIKNDGGEGIYRCPPPTSARVATTTGSAAKSQVQQVPVRGHPLEYAMCQDCKDWIQLEFLIICRWCKSGPFCKFHNYGAVDHCKRKCPNMPS